MLNLIQINENKNKLKSTTKIEPIVCGNSNYHIKFTFDEEWSKVSKKLAMFEVLDKTILLEFEGDTIDVPAMPNANCFMLALTCSPKDGQSLMTNVIKIPLEQNKLGENVVVKSPFESYYAKIVSLINSLEGGEFSVKTAEKADLATYATNAKNAENATHATSSDTATTAENATHATSADTATTATSATSAETANYATSAGTAETATSATTATNAENATHATSADTATTATTATSATTAESATYATTAGKSETQVSKTGNEEISGIKNFANEVRKYTKPLLNSEEVSNENLLLNDEMTINQRGKSVYYGANKYGTDRWMVVDDLAFMRLNTNSQWVVGIEDSDEQAERIIISQKVENFKNLRGKALMCTFNYNDFYADVINSVKLEVYDGVKSTTISVLPDRYTAKVNAVISSNADRVEVRVKTASNGKDVSLRFVSCKLEVGSIQTPIFSKNPAKALAECQRYYQCCSTLGCSNVPKTATSIDIPINLCTTLRDTPTITVSAKPTISGNGQNISSTSYEFSSITKNKAIVNFKSTQSMTLNQVYTLSDVGVEFDAEMY